MRIRRRSLLKLAAAAPALPACVGRSSRRFFDDGELAALTRLVDLVLPPDDETPGASELGVVAYIDLFLSGDGLIFGSGPFSGRTPFPDARGLPTSEYPPDAFADAEPLDRVQRAAVYARLFGDGGLRPLFRKNLKSVTDKTTLEDLDETFLDALVQLVFEGAFSAPEYGGNRDMLGWQMVHYEGDLMPLGFSTFDEVAGVYRERADALVSRPDDRLDPDPIDADVDDFLSTAVAILGGRDTKAG